MCHLVFGFSAQIEEMFGRSDLFGSVNTKGRHIIVEDIFMLIIAKDNNGIGIERFKFLAQARNGRFALRGAGQMCLWRDFTGDCRFGVKGPFGSGGQIRPFFWWHDQLRGVRHGKGTNEFSHDCLLYFVLMGLSS